MNPHKRAGLLLLAVLLCFGGIWWLCRRDPSIPVLISDGPAKWIVYPKPPDTSPHPARACTARFRAAFQVSKDGGPARLSVRFFHDGTVAINGQVISFAHAPGANWKRPVEVEVGPFLRAGRNEIEAWVTNTFGPPAVCLEISGAQVHVATDRAWDCSFLGAAWQKAALASDEPMVRPGNYLFGRETLRTSLAQGWAPALGILFCLLMGSVLMWRCGIAPPESRARKIAAWISSPAGFLLCILVLWVALFANDIAQIAPLLGFDRDGHLEYIDHLLQKHSLPLADEGWQMYQPPLFYLLSAILVSPFDSTASSGSSVLLLRCFCALISLAHIVVVFLCLRLLFPDKPRLQKIALAIAAFMPAQLYLAPHITNETLAATLVTAAIYFGLVSNRAPQQGLKPALLAGAFLGLAMLTKFSALIAIPFVLVLLARKTARAGRELPACPNCWKFPAMALGAMLLICGWHYGRVWSHFGSPLIGNWDPRLSFAWWQEPGYHTPIWYCHFGEAFVSPLFSSMHSFADGLYSTLWGDGLCGGSARMDFRPAWNYSLMNFASLFALTPTLLIIIGGIASVRDFVQHPDRNSLLLAGLPGAFLFAIILMSLRVPSYAQVKAFYALPGLLPICALGAVGWEVFSRRASRLARFLPSALACWAALSLCSFWIWPGNSSAAIARGINFADDRQFPQAVEQFSKALSQSPASVPAQVQLIESLHRAGDQVSAREHALRFFQTSAQNPQARLQWGISEAFEGHYSEAIPLIQSALEGLPDHVTAHESLVTCQTKTGPSQQVIDTCSRGLRVNPFNERLHYQLALAAAALNRMPLAGEHLKYALLLKPDFTEAQTALEAILGGAAKLTVEELAASLEKTPDDQDLRLQYAGELANHGRILEARTEYEKILATHPDRLEALNNLAWLLAVSPDDSVRNGARAVELAEKACALTQNRQPVLLGTLAAAYAEAGNFELAIQTSQKAIDLALAAGTPEVARKNQELQTLYREKKPFREK